MGIRDWKWCFQKAKGDVVRSADERKSRETSGMLAHFSFTSTCLGSTISNSALIPDPFRPPTSASWEMDEAGRVAEVSCLVYTFALATDTHARRLHLLAHHL